MTEQYVHRLHPGDNVAVALADLPGGEVEVIPDGRRLAVPQPIPFGHKVALEDIPAGHPVLKYGAPVGMATVDIAGVSRQVALDLVPETRVGDYVIVHVGCAIERLDRAEAAATLALLNEFLLRSVSTPTENR